MNKENITLLMVNDYPDYIDPREWRAALGHRVPGLDFRLWPERGDPADIDIVMIDKGTSPGFFEGMTRLRAVAYLAQASMAYCSTTYRRGSASSAWRPANSPPK